MARGYDPNITENSLSESLDNVASNKINEWTRFLEIAQEQKESAGRDKGVQIFIDTDVKKTLEKLKLSGLKYPVRSLLNAAVKVFLEANKDKINEQLENL